VPPVTPSARVQAAIELLDAIITAVRDGGAAADTIVTRYFSTRRYAGSKDRRAVRDLVYDAIRLAGPVPANGRAAMLLAAERDPALREYFDGSPHGPAAIDPDERPADAGVAPKWLTMALRKSGLSREEIAGLIDRAPLDVRVNRVLAQPDETRAEMPEAQPIAGLDDALRLPTGANVAPLGPRVEVQDAGSQWVTLASGAAPDTLAVDLCAGGGGKTLALAAMMENRGRIVAADVDRARLSRLAPRAARAGVTIAETRLLDPSREAAALADLDGAADVVLIDAPCSGTGTWRRNPEARWRLTPDRLKRLAEVQARLLPIGARLVRPGGRLVYIVCSLLDAEGRDQVDRFLADHPGWTAVADPIPVGTPHGAGRRLTPATDRTDGFFVACLTAPC
jgi:16S rRNA (cytosine967-C5)-methyltransferase